MTVYVSTHVLILLQTSLQLLSLLNIEMHVYLLVCFSHYYLRQVRADSSLEVEVEDICLLPAVCFMPQARTSIGMLSYIIRCEGIVH